MSEFPSLEVASFIAKTCDEMGFPWNNTKIQKLLYCCYGCFLAANGERLCDEYPRAWQFGPVFPRVFNHIHKKKSFPQDCPLSCAPEEQKAFLREVIKVFGRYNAVPLSNWTHKKGSPWDTVVNRMGEGLGGFIPDDIIRKYFAENIVEKIPNGAS